MFFGEARSSIYSSVFLLERALQRPISVRELKVPRTTTTCQDAVDTQLWDSFIYLFVFKKKYFWCLYLRFIALPLTFHGGWVGSTIHFDIKYSSTRKLSQSNMNIFQIIPAATRLFFLTN